MGTEKQTGYDCLPLRFCPFFLTLHKDWRAGKKGRKKTFAGGKMPEQFHLFCEEFQLAPP